MSEEMSALAAQQDGYLGADSVFDSEAKKGITVSYWRDLESIKKWKENARHREAQAKGRKLWYSSFNIHISKVERTSKMSKL
jgi:heme-degrading monooxygenase HmoA